jgi:glycerol kinase
LIEKHTTDTQEGKTVIQQKCGLPLSSYFSALKLKWILENVPEAAQACKEDRCMFGTVDTWLLWVRS